MLVHGQSWCRKFVKISTLWWIFCTFLFGILNFNSKGILNFTIKAHGDVMDYSHRTHLAYSSAELRALKPRLNTRWLNEDTTQLITALEIKRGFRGHRGILSLLNTALQRKRERVANYDVNNSVHHELLMTVKKNSKL